MEKYFPEIISSLLGIIAFFIVRTFKKVDELEKSLTELKVSLAELKIAVKARFLIDDGKKH